MRPKMTFDRASADFVLKAVGMEVDHDGYITKNGARVEDLTHSENIHVDRLGGISKHGVFSDDDTLLWDLTVIGYDGQTIDGAVEWVREKHGVEVRVVETCTRKRWEHHKDGRLQLASDPSINHSEDYMLVAGLRVAARRIRTYFEMI